MESPFDQYYDHYKDIGALLTEARREMNLGIEQAAHMLHIRVRYIEALEKGHLEDLPGLPYAKGYLQTYATFLQLDKDEILRRFEAIEEIIGRKAFYFPQTLTKTKHPSRAMIWGGLAVAALFYVIWSFAMQPKHVEIQVVEPYSEAARKAAVPATSPYDVACLHKQDVLYPPCTLKAPRFALVPVQKGRMDTVLYLAHQITTYNFAGTKVTAETAPEDEQPANDEHADEKPAEKQSAEKQSAGDKEPADNEDDDRPPADDDEPDDGQPVDQPDERPPQ